MGLWLFHLTDARGALSFEGGAADADVREFGAFAGGAEEESAATHVAAPDEIAWKH
jgi:hypothetical protein